MLDRVNAKRTVKQNGTPGCGKGGGGGGVLCIITVYVVFWLLLHGFILVPIGAKLKCEEVKDGVGNRRKKLIYK